jgi:hypothetical protein
MRSQVRFPVLPWEFFLAGEDPHSDRGLGSLKNLGLRPLLVLNAHIYVYMYICNHSHNRANVTAPYGRPNLRSRLHFGHNQEGRTTKSIWTCGGNGGKNGHTNQTVPSVKVYKFCLLSFGSESRLRHRLPWNKAFTALLGSFRKTGAWEKTLGSYSTNFREILSCRLVKACRKNSHSVKNQTSVDSKFLPGYNDIFHMTVFFIV